MGFPFLGGFHVEGVQTLAETRIRDQNLVKEYTWGVLSAPLVLVFRKIFWKSKLLVPRFEEPRLVGTVPNYAFADQHGTPKNIIRGMSFWGTHILGSMLICW